MALMSVLPPLGYQPNYYIAAARRLLQSNGITTGGKDDT
jgi:hypothetical protein